MHAKRLIALLTGIALAHGSAQAAPAMWKVSDEDSSVWLFGSVHMLPPDTQWRTPHFEKVLAKADRVYFETDISPESQVAITTRTFELGFNQDGRLLSDVIGPDMTARLREAASDYGQPVAMLLTMRPWMAANTLSLGAIMEMNYDPLLGVETVVSGQVPVERRGFLETVDQQLDFLAGGDDAEQIAMLEATLDTLDMIETDLNAMVASWLAGEPEALGELFLTQTGGYDQATLERLIDTRNHDWVQQIEAMLANNENNLLIVGAAHLAGEVSVVRLLEDAGFTSERVQ